MNVIEKNITLPDGRVITLETGKLAKQADGAVMLKMGNTMLLATVVSAQEAGPDVDFMPLSVDYKEKFASVGRFPGGFTKREGKASDYEILVSRLIDRALRPLFPDDYHAETFVQVTLYSGDEESMPDSLAGLAASAAIAVSDIPFHGPISEVRVARVNGEFVINPTCSQLKEADLDIMVGATYENIMMVEGELVTLVPYIFTQFLIIHFMAIGTFRLTDSLCQLFLYQALFFDGSMGTLDSIKHFLLGNFIHFTFHHHEDWLLLLPLPGVIFLFMVRFLKGGWVGLKGNLL